MTTQSNVNGTKPGNRGNRPQLDEATRQDTIQDINHDLGKTRNPNVLKSVQRFMQRPDARVFVPGSLAATRLFYMVVDLDRIFTNVEREKFRIGNSKTLQEKHALEQQVMVLCETLAEIIAQMAVDNQQTDKVRDPAVLEKMKQLLQAKKAALAEVQAHEEPTRRRGRGAVVPVSSEPPAVLEDPAAVVNGS